MAREFDRSEERPVVPMPPPMAFPDRGMPESEVLGEIEARLAHDPYPASQVANQQFLVRKRSARVLDLRIERGIERGQQRFEGLVERPQHQSQPHRLLLQHPDIRHHLLMLAVGAANRSDHEQGDDPAEHERRK